MITIQLADTEHVTLTQGDQVLRIPLESVPDVIEQLTRGLGETWFAKQGKTFPILIAEVDDE